MSEAIKNPLKELAQRGCFSVTGSDPVVLKACMKNALEKNEFFICEATVNQVNQFGGYTGMKPKDYADMVCGFAEELGFPKEKVILSGDHLGPFIWKDINSDEAMENSKELVRQYVKAGFRKIHLDPTMPLKGDNLLEFGDEIIAQRAAELAITAEETYEDTKEETSWRYRPVYVIGSEVPVPGGTEEIEEMQVTKPEDLIKTLENFKKAFRDKKLSRVWENTVAVVAQIGLEFSEDNVYEYCSGDAYELSKALKKYPGLCFESHSSDYQTTECLQNMVKDGVGILKVGPELTFAHREALFALSIIENEMASIHHFEPSYFMEVLDKVMLSAEPNYWIQYYHGSKEELQLKRKYSYSDRCRYYFEHSQVKKAEGLLIEHLSGIEIPLYLVSQYLPVQYQKIREGKIFNHPMAMIEDKIRDVMDRYYTNMLKGVKLRDY